MPPLSLILAVLCAILLPCGGTAAEGRAQSTPEAMDRRIAAAEAYRAGDLGEAIAQYEALAAEDPQDPRPQYDLMRLYNAAARHLDCARAAEALLALGEDKVDVHIMRAHALHRAARYREAHAAYDTILDRWPERTELRLSRAQTLEALREWAAAAAELAALRRDEPGLIQAIPTQARVLTALGRYPEAAATWDEAVRVFPDQPGYRFAAAETHFQANQPAVAVAGMHQLLEDDPHHVRARRFLVQHAIVQGRLADALALLETAPPSPDPVPALLQRAGLHLRLGDAPSAVGAVEAALRHDPASGEALLLQASLLREQQQTAAAVARLEQLTAANPACLEAWLLLADIRFADGDIAGAREALRPVREHDPTHPLWLLRDARYRHAAGEHADAVRMLRDWLAANPGPALPALLYHGLTTRPDDPLLASRVHMTTTAFAGQMQALRDADYTAVSTTDIRDWLVGNRELPPRPVWIAFDDGRLDSFREATPILARHGFRATMFVAGINAGRNLPNYASWEELAAIMPSGIWDLQSHGDRASLHVPTNADGDQGLFLAYRQWLADAGRLETQAAWRERVAAEYATGAATMHERLGVRPIAFAWPEGHYGQRGIPTGEDAAAYNLQQARAHFALGFHQEGAGINVRTRDPMLLTRFEPDPATSGADLIRHMHVNNPVVLVRAQLLQFALTEGDAERARHWLDAMRDHPWSPVERLQQELRVLYLSQDYTGCVSTADVLLRALEGAGAGDPKAFLDACNTRGWSLVALGRRDEALQAFVASLKRSPDQIPILVAAADTAVALSRYRLADWLLTRARRLDPGHARAVPAHGRVLSLLNRHAEATRAWTEAAALFPLHIDYIYLSEESRFRAGDTAAAEAALQTLLRDHPEHDLTREFLVRLALAANDTARAIELLEAAPGADAPPARLRLADLCLRRQDAAGALRHLDAALRIDPTDGDALLLKAEVLHRLGRPREAELLFREVIASNRWSLRGWIGLGDACATDGRPAEALTAIRAARALDPTNPHLLLREAQAHYAAGQPEEARMMLERWLAVNPEPALPVLVYHGLTPRAQDPLLASRTHMRTDAFAHQLRALRAAGYESITAEDIRDWLARKRTLPRRAIWITFDEGRRDSVREATPLLRRYGFTAALFVEGANASRNLPGHVGWRELAAIQTNRLWELQSHGLLTASNIIVQASGRTGMFLTNRRWLPRDGALETVADWHARITDAYAVAAERLTVETGARPIAFAWPQGQFGSEGIPNAPGAAPANLAAAREHYALAFHQDAYGLNVRTRDPALLTRLEPDPAWSGDDLLRHLADEAPAARITLQLLKQATWEGRLHDARRLHARLVALGTTRGQQSLAAALIHSAAGEQAQARTLVMEGMDPSSRQAADVLDTIARRDRARQTFSARHWSDDDQRRTWEAAAEHRSAAHGPYQWTGAMRAAQHREAGFETVGELAPGLGVRRTGGLYHHLAAEFALHAFDGGPDSQWGGASTWVARWTDTLISRLHVEQAPVYTVQAMQASIDSLSGRGDVTWRPNTLWDATLRGSWTDYSDDNRRHGLGLEFQRHFTPGRGFTLVGQCVYDDATDDSPLYYAPQELWLGRLGVQYDRVWGASRRLRLRYLPGYGVEAGEDSRIIHAARAELRWPLANGLELQPAANIQHTPTYHSVGASLALQHDF